MLGRMILWHKRIEGTLYDLSQCAKYTEARLKAGTRYPVWLGDEIVGWVRKERRRTRGRREGWRWIGYRDRALTDELRDAASTDKMATARALAVAWMQAIAAREAACGRKLGVLDTLAGGKP